MEKDENARTRLIKTASRLFQLQGYHATGLNQIIKESGAPKGSLYYHFPNGKGQLAIESVQQTARFVSENIEKGLSKISDPVQAIQNFIIEMGKSFQSDRFEGIPIASVALEAALISDPLRKECQAAYETFQNIFTKKLVNSGYEINKARELGIVINAMLEGAFLTSYTLGHNEPLLLVAKQIPVLLT